MVERGVVMRRERASSPQLLYGSQNFMNVMSGLQVLTPFLFHYLSFSYFFRFLWAFMRHFSCLRNDQGYQSDVFQLGPRIPVVSHMSDL